MAQVNNLPDPKAYRTYAEYKAACEVAFKAANPNAPTRKQKAYTRLEDLPEWLITLKPAERVSAIQSRIDSYTHMMPVAKAELAKANAKA